MTYICQADNSNQLSTRILNSPTFTFQIGPQKKDFVLHYGAISRVSRPLTALMNQGTHQRQNAAIWLQPERVETFEKFCQFLYTGDYSMASDSNEGNGTGWGTTEGPHWNPNFEAPYTYASDPWAAFQDMTFTPGDPFLTPGYGWSNNTTQRVSETALLTHARVFVFAERFNVDDLGNLALGKLHNSLCTFPLRVANAEDIVELLKFCYQDMELVGMGPMRELVTRYVACKVHLLADYPSFKRLVQSPSTVAWDLIQATAYFRKMEIADPFKQQDRSEAEDSWTERSRSDTWGQQHSEWATEASIHFNEDGW